MTRNYHEFIDSLTNEVSSLLPENESHSINVSEVTKLNGSYMAMTIRVGETGHMHATAAMNLDKMYNGFLNGEATVPELAREAVRISMMPTPHEVSHLDWMLDYAKAKDRLFVRISNAERNADTLENVPYQIVPGTRDLALTYHIRISNEETGMLTSTTVTEGLLSQWGVSQEQLHEDALKSAQTLNPPTLSSIHDVLVKTLGVSPEDVPQPTAPAPVFVLSNRASVNGAASLLYPGVQEELAERMGGDYYVLPSSIHEVLIMPADAGVDPASLEKMVRDINASIVEPEDRLSDHVYHYDNSAHKLERMDVYVNRLEDERTLSREDSISQHENKPLTQNPQVLKINLY